MSWSLSLGAYPADPPKVEEIVAVMRTAGDGAHGRRLRGLIVVSWRAGLRIQEALALAKGDLDYRRGALLVGRGKGGRRREVGMDTWGWEELQPWLELRGTSCRPLVLCAQRPNAWPSVVDRRRSSRVAAHCRRGRCPPAVRSASAAPRPRRRDAAKVCRSSSSSASSATATSASPSVYLQGIDNAEIIDTVHTRRAPMIPVSTSLRL
jgi:integrase